MKLSLGIIGLPNVGKSTLFKALTKQEVNIANYPFTTIDPNVAVVPVEDERLEKVAALSHPEKILPAVIEFVDIAGLVKGANRGEGLGNQFLAQIRETNAIIQVVRCFENSDVAHLEGNINPLRDIDIINTELILKDLETIQKRKEKIKREAQSGNKELKSEFNLLEKIEKILNSGKLLVSELSEQEINDPILKNLFLLTAKKQIYLLNGPQQSISSELIKKIESLKSEFFVANLSQNPQLTPLIKKAYQTLNLITFFTIVGEKEARAWALKKGTPMIEAAGIIHSDFQEKFIKAEVINWQKLLEAGGWHKAREKGWIATEGKDYLVQDGDVVVIKHR
ncbi:redox-regulated ATPase YchF [bacterium]|nr:redox-regulated ATPase YchF [bacterium]